MYVFLSLKIVSINVDSSSKNVYCRVMTAIIPQEIDVPFVARV